MRISIHTDTLIELAESLNRTESNQASILTLLAQPECEFWAPALCLAAAYEVIRQKHGDVPGRRLLEFVQKRISNVPLRGVTLTDCLQNNIGNLEAASHMSVNSLVGIDAVLSSTLQSSQINGLRCMTPNELLAQDFEMPLSGAVPFLDLKAQYSKVYNEFDDRLTEIMSNTGFILGHHVEEFESAFAKLQGAKYCIGLSSGTDALHLAFMALGIGPGDEVIVPANTFFATAEGVSLTGATPVFVDSNVHYNIDVDSTRRLLEQRGSSSQIKAIVPVHLYGQPADIDGVVALANEFGLYIVEDCAQAHLAEYRGSSVGNFGAFGVFSFYPGKNLGAYGEAGALITNDDGLYEMARRMRAHGEASKYKHSEVGHNYRMEAIQGAVLSTKVKFITEWTEARQRNARKYKALLAGIREVQVPEEPDFAKSVHHLFVIQVEDRDELRAYLDQNGIASGLHYPLPLHLQAAYKDLNYHVGDFPRAESQAERIISLPMYPELTEYQIERVCNTIKQYFSNK